MNVNRRLSYSFLNIYNIHVCYKYKINTITNIRFIFLTNLYNNFNKFIFLKVSKIFKI